MKKYKLHSLDEGVTRLKWDCVQQVNWEHTVINTIWELCVAGTDLWTCSWPTRPFWTTIEPRILGVICRGLARHMWRMHMPSGCPRGEWDLHGCNCSTQAGHYRECPFTTLALVINLNCVCSGLAKQMMGVDNDPFTIRHHFYAGHNNQLQRVCIVCSRRTPGSLKALLSGKDRRNDEHNVCYPQCMLTIRASLTGFR